MSGCPIFRWYTFLPLRLASSENGTSFLIGDAGIDLPLSDIDGIII
jgi:hypothetical protein